MEASRNVDYEEPDYSGQTLVFDIVKRKFTDCRLHYLCLADAYSATLDVHRLVLSRSPYFDALFRQTRPTSEFNDEFNAFVNAYTVTFPFSSNAFKKCIDQLYEPLVPKYHFSARNDTNDNKDEDLTDLLQAIAFLQLRPGPVATRVLKRLFLCENTEERMSTLHVVASSQLAQKWKDGLFFV
jgi:hypothetical protein